MSTPIVVDVTKNEYLGSDSRNQSRGSALQQQADSTSCERELAMSRDHHVSWQPTSDLANYDRPSLLV